MQPLLQALQVTGGIQARHSKEGLRIETGTRGGKLRFTAPPELAENDFIAFQLSVEGNEQLTFELEFYEGEFVEDLTGTPDFRCRMGFMPGVKIQSCFDLEHLDNQTLYILRTPGRMKTVIGGKGLRKEDVKYIALKFYPRFKSQTLILHSFQLTKERPVCGLASESKRVDALGQATFRSWPEKTASVEDLAVALRDQWEHRNHRDFHGDRTGRYGGFKQKSFAASGYFRLEREGDRFWMVDPEGFVFFSTGADCIHPGEFSKIDGIEPLFEWLPDRHGEFAFAYDSGGSDSTDCYFSFFRANLYRAFGENWYDAWKQLTKSRLQAWGFNTIANWADPHFRSWSQLPYVFMPSSFPTTQKLIFRDFPDVFSEEYARDSEKYAKSIESLKSDPLMIGYFMRNEPKWAFAGKINLAREMFRTAHPFVGKEKLIQFLRFRYEDRIDSLNAKWGRNFSRFEEILSLSYDEMDGKADEDLFDFTRIMIQEYVRVPAVNLKRVAPNHLNLGMRYAWISSDLVYSGSEYFDVFSINCYQFRPDPATVDHIYKHTGKPVIIGEFHFGAPDAGLMSYGLRTVATQRARGEAYRYFVEQAVAMNNVLGVHYFQWNDQGTLGRNDGEAYQIGLTDVCHKPYASFVEGIRTAHRHVPWIMFDGHRSLEQHPAELRAQKI